MNSNQYGLPAITKRTPVVDHIRKTITISDSFARAAADIGNPEFQYLVELQKICPDYRIFQRTVRKPKKTIDRISYGRMRKYIGCLRNSDKYLALFDSVVKYSHSQRAPYQCVAEWFCRSFPDYGTMVDFDEEGYPIVAENVIPFDDYKKEYEDREKKAAV